MNYNIKGSDISITPELREYVEKRLTKHAEKFLGNDSTALADIELQYAVAHEGGKYRAEFTISASGAIYRVEEWGTTMHEAIDLAAGELQRGLRQEKKKKLHVVRRGALRVKEYLRGWRSDI